MSLKLCKTAVRVLSKHKHVKHRCLGSHTAVCSRFSHHQSSRRCSSAVLSMPGFEGVDKQYPQKIKDIVDQISQLSLLEVADLNEYLKKTLRITDAPMMAAGMAAAPAAKAVEEEPESKFVQTEFTVSLTKFDTSKKVALIKVLKGIIDGMNLVQAKKFVESAPQVVKADLSKDDADKLKKQLEAAGATIEIE